MTATFQRETQTIPIVFSIVADPVGSGFVASLPRPGGNITGFGSVETSFASKWLELLTAIAPGVKRAANDVQSRHGSLYQTNFPAFVRGRCPIVQSNANRSARS